MTTKILELPAFNPIGDETFARGLNDAARAAGIMIYGDYQTGRSTRALQLVEERLGIEQVICFVYDKRAFHFNENVNGEPSKFKVHTFGGKRGQEAHGFPLLPTDGATFGNLAAVSGESFVFDVSCFDYGEVTKFFHGFLAWFMTTSTLPATILIDDLNVGIARRRGGGDSPALKTFHSLVVRGRNDGHKFIGVSTSPGEIPLESRNEVNTSIVTGSKTDNHVRQLVPVFGDTILQYARFGTFGILRQPAGHHWAKIPTDRDDCLSYLPRSEFRTGLGSGRPLRREVQTAGSPEIIAKVVAARPKKNVKGNGTPNPTEPDGNGGDTAGTETQGTTATASGKTEKTSTKPRKPRTPTQDLTSSGMYSILKAMGHRNVVVHSNIARSLLAIDRDVFPGKQGVVAVKDILAQSLTNASIIDSTRWTRTNGDALSKIISETLAGAVHNILVREDAEEAPRFMDGLAGRQPRSRAVDDLVTSLMRLRVGTAPLMSKMRLDLVMKAWSAHLRETAPKGGEVVAMPVAGEAIRKAA